MTKEILIALPEAGKAFKMGTPIADVMAIEFPHPSLVECAQEAWNWLGDKTGFLRGRLTEELQNPLPLLTIILEFLNREEGTQISGSTIEASLMITAFSLLTLGAVGCGPGETTIAGMSLTEEQRSVLETGISASTREAIVNVARGELGICGEAALKRYVGGKREAWCTELIWYCYKKGAPSLFANLGGLEIFDSSQMENLFRALGQWGKDKIPEPGDYVRFYFGVDEDGVHLFHSGLVEKVEVRKDGSYILHTIEGKVCQDPKNHETCCVREQQYESADPHILGFGYLPRGTKQPQMASTPVVEKKVQSSNKVVRIEAGGESKTGQPGVHVVQRGENLFRIAQRYGVTVKALAAANNITDPDKIYIGQRLTIPGSGGIEASTTPPSQPEQLKATTFTVNIEEPGGTVQFSVSKTGQPQVSPIEETQVTEEGSSPSCLVRNQGGGSAMIWSRTGGNTPEGIPIMQATDVVRKDCFWQYTGNVLFPGFDGEDNVPFYEVISETGDVRYTEVPPP